ncbi:helix-turn-helix domain-containing protein [Clostridium sp. LP20]|uniref:helix-turn-helix domain-containing protein n=1 Tax=Clostridium sp. LP20 TaxID=3418665 RepID=UPI003EE4E894
MYKGLPENTIGERIEKARLKLNIDRIEFAKSIGAEIKTVYIWEKKGIIPEASSIKKISDTYNIPLEYFHYYYAVYYNKPEEAFRKWRIDHNYNNVQVSKMIKAVSSTLYTFENGTYKLSFDLYLQLKELGIF